MGQQSSRPSRRYQTALAVVEAYNAWNLTQIMGVRTPDCLSQVLPTSMGRPQLNNTAYAANLANLLPQFDRFHVTVNQLIEDPAENKVVLWARSDADTAVGKYNNEYMLLFHFNEKGDKITRFYEFVDSLYSTEHFAKIKQLADMGNSTAAPGGGVPWKSGGGGGGAGHKARNVEDVD